MYSTNDIIYSNMNIPCYLSVCTAAPYGPLLPCSFGCNPLWFQTSSLHVKIKLFLQTEVAERVIYRKLVNYSFSFHETRFQNI